MLSLEQQECLDAKDYYAERIREVSERASLGVLLEPPTFKREYACLQISRIIFNKRTAHCSR